MGREPHEDKGLMIISLLCHEISEWYKPGKKKGGEYVQKIQKSIPKFRDGDTPLDN